MLIGHALLSAVKMHLFLGYHDKVILGKDQLDVSESLDV